LGVFTLKTRGRPRLQPKRPRWKPSQSAFSNTARLYEDCLRRTLAFHPLAEIPMSKVTSELIGKYVNFRRSLPEGNSVAALNAELRTLRRAFRLAEEWALIPKAPVIHELPGKANRERVISFEEEARYLAAASPTLRDIATLAVDTALRPNSELFPLRWTNVHLKPSAEGPYGFIHVHGGKTDAAQRNIPLTPRANAILEARRAARVVSLYVFPGKGKSGFITTVQHAHERTVKRSGLEPFEFYCWRHTCGTRWAESRMDKFTVARLMGHSSPRVAERYYIHVTEPHVSAGFERFLDYLDGKLKGGVRGEVKGKK
jgi:integrase